MERQIFNKSTLAKMVGCIFPEMSLRLLPNLSGFLILPLFLLIETFSLSSASAQNWVSVSAGAGHTMAIRADGTLWAWGHNLNGQLGIGNTTGMNRPTQVSVATDWASVSAGANHTLAIRTNGTLWAWGNNANGRLGDNTTTPRTAPVQVGSNNNWALVSSGDGHSLAIRTDGTLWAWGRNADGQLGVGDAANRLVPTQVGTDTDWEYVAGDGSHSLAIKRDGTLWAWGRNTNGQLGLGDRVNRNTPTQVGTLSTWSHIAAGEWHSLAIRSDSTLWAWGGNGGGELGLGHTNEIIIPTQVGTLAAWSSVCAGDGFTMAISADGSLWAWGANTVGQLGLGHTSDATTPTKVGNATDLASVSNGGGHTIALTADAKLWAWGQGNFGQLGLGDLLNRNFPSNLLITLLSIPNGIVGTTYSDTLTATGGVLPYTWSVSAGTLPPGLSIDSDNQVISGTPTVAGTYNFTVQLRDSGNPQQASTRIYNIRIFDPLTITTPLLQNAIAGTTYSQTLTATGGGTPYAWSVVSGALPVGLSLNAATGAISGTPTTAGTYDFTIQVRDAGTPQQAFTRAYTIVIHAPLSFVPVALPNEIVDTAYSQTLTATGGVSPFTWSVLSGTLPPGISIDSDNQVISGTPTVAGTYNFTIQVQDSGIPQQTATRAYNIRIFDTLTITTPLLPNGIAGTTYSQTLNATGGGTPYTWSVSSGTLPSGLSLNAATGAISGTPITAGTYDFTIQVRDAVAPQQTLTRAYTVVIHTPLAFVPTALPNEIVDTAYSQTLTATGGVSPFTWSILSGTLPSGLSFDAENQIISGTPTVAGTFNFTIQVQDSGTPQQTSTRAYTIRIFDPLTITTPLLQNGIAGTTYSQTLTATGGGTPYTWSVSSGTLPSGLSLNAATGTISGTPTTAGTYDFTIQVRDAVAPQQTLTRAYTVVIHTPLAFVPTALPNEIVGKAYSQTLTATGGVSPFTWSLLSGTLPSGLSFDAENQVISGTPTVAGTFNFTIQVRDSGTPQQTSIRAYTVTIYGELAIATSALPNGITGAVYSKTLMASGWSEPFTWSLLSGTLPEGLSLNATTGVISGTPTTSGTYNFTLQVKDSGTPQKTATKTFSINIYGLLATNPTTISQGIVGTPFSQTFTASGGASPYVWSVSDGNLPPGLTFEAETRSITGIPTTAGTFNFTIWVQDSGTPHQTFTRDYTVRVYDRLIITTSELANVNAGTSYSQTLTASGGAGLYTWSVSSGTLPNGLSLNASTGVISGTPNTPGTYHFTARVVDSGTLQQYFEQPFTVIIDVTSMVISSCQKNLTDMVLVYPIPANHVLNVRMNSNVDYIRMFNYFGQLVMEQSVDGDNHVQINVSNLPNGAYILLFSTNEGSVFQKRFIVAR